MKIESSYEKLKNYYYIGNYLAFIELYDNTKTPTAKESFLVIKVLSELRKWDTIDTVLVNLKKSQDTYTKIRAELTAKLFSLINENSSREKWVSIFNRCDEVTKNNNQSDLLFYAEFLKIKSKLTLLKLGLIDANEKTKFIKKCLELYESYKHKNIEKVDLFELLLTAISYISKPPKPNFKRAYQLLQNHISNGDFNYINIPFYHLELELKLKIAYFKRELFIPTQLPDFIKPKLILEKKYPAYKGFIHCIYGLHLLELECKEGITWLQEGIIKIWEYGHYQKATDNKNTALTWLKDRGDLIILKKFEKATSFIRKTNKAPIEKRVAKLHKSHQYLIEGDYYMGEKLLLEQLKKTTNEALKVHLINSIVNHSSKLSFDNKEQVLLIDKTLKELKYLNNSILVAQLHSFKTILNPESKNFDKAIHAFEELGMIEGIINQLINRFSVSANLYRIKKKPIPKEVWGYLDKANLYLTSNIWIKNRNTLSGKLWQTLGLAYSFGNNFKKANEVLEKASEYFLKSNNLIFYANNAYFLSMSLIGLGRQHKDIKFYTHARTIIINALKILHTSNIYDFIWRLKFGVAISYYDPITRNLIKDDEKYLYQKEASKYFDLALNSVGIIIDNTLSQTNSKVLESIISLKREMKQLIFTGFYLNYYNQDWIQCVNWLEKVRVKSLLSAMSKNINPDKVILKNALIEKERTLKNRIQAIDRIEKKKDLEYKLKSLYKEMAENPLTKDYALKKLISIPNYNDLLNQIKKDGQLLNNRNLFFLYYYVHLDVIYAFGISEFDPPKFVEIPISAYKIKKEYYNFPFELATNKALGLGHHNLEEFHELIKPLEEWTNPNDIICIIPYGVLQNFPFHILLINEEPLISRNPVFYNSSLTSWTFTKSNIRDKDVLSQPYIFGKPNKDLEKSKEEVSSVAAMLNCKAYIEDKVSKSKFKEALLEGSLVHFAGHGSYEASKGFLSALQLHNKETITAKEIMNFNRMPEFVVLSSCNTALQKNHNGEEQAGIIPALLSAGTKTVLAGMWSVIDEDAKDFFILFYKKLNDGLPKVIAYQETTKELMKRKNRSNFYNWGMFALIGDWE